MKRTGPGVLVLAAAAGAVAGFVVDQLFTATGRPTFTPTVSLPILLLLIGGIVVLLAVPVRRATRGAGRVPVDPFRALRVAMLAKASSIVGAAVGGFALGLLAFLLTRPVTPSVGSMGEIIATIVASAALVVAGLVAEHLCTIRKDDDDEHPGAGDPGLHAGDG
ncbi:MAG: DUF3180 domain-containing protein [Microbacterium sp.]